MVPKSVVEGKLADELEFLKRRVGMGHEAQVKWVPGTIKFKNGKQLDEEVLGDTILIYAEDPSRANELLAHGFAEWLLNQHTKRYRLMINKLIELFEEIQYDQKEKLVSALTRLLTTVCRKEAHGLQPSEELRP
jgi:hypothetical protein